MSDSALPPWKQGIFTVVFGTADIAYTWAGKIYGAVTTKSEETKLLEQLVGATRYEDWWAAASALDDLSDKYDWRVNPIDDLYDYRLIEERRRELNRLRRNDNVIAVANCLRQGLLRNLFNITRLPLYDKAYAGTKDNIQWYIEESVEAIRYIADTPTSTTTGAGRLTAQEKLDVLYDSRKSFGCTALLLQGGSIFGLCHLGVVKALLEHGILPKVIVGTSTGALIAALVGIHTVQELPSFVSGDSIDLRAFAAASARAREKTEDQLGDLEFPPNPSRLHNCMETLERRAWRLIEEGFILDPDVLEECIEANVGDITFREAFERTERILNIIISSPSEEIPSLMNYLTAPDVLIRSAAMASHITNMARMPKSGIQLLYKEADGSIRQYDFRPGSSKGRRPPTATDPRKTPLARLRQQFNIDHFIISQARPYIAPFLKPSLPYIRNKPTGINAVAAAPSRMFALPDLGGVVKHGLLLADIIGWLPDNLRRVLSDELIQGDSLTLVPEVYLSDYRRLLKNPTREEVNFWIVRGERAVWPSLCALKVRCMIEMALDQAYERVRRRGTDDPFPLLMAQMDSRPQNVQPAVANGDNGLGTHEHRGKMARVLDGDLVDSDGEGNIGVAR